jgi:hypothetical protein
MQREDRCRPRTPQSRYSLDRYSRLSHPRNASGEWREPSRRVVDVEERGGREEVGDEAPSMKQSKSRHLLGAW